MKDARSSKSDVIFTSRLMPWPRWSLKRRVEVGVNQISHIAPTRLPLQHGASTRVWPRRGHMFSSSASPQAHKRGKPRR